MGGRKGRDSKEELRHLHRANKQLDTSHDLIMQMHLQIRKPHGRHTEDNDIGNQIRDPSPKPARTCWSTLATGETGRPCCSQGLALAEIVCDGAHQEAANGNVCSPVDDLCRPFPGACDEDAAVEDYESEFEEAEGGGPGEFFDKEGLSCVNGVMLNW